MKLILTLILGTAAGAVGLRFWQEAQRERQATGAMVAHRSTEIGKVALADGDSISVSRCETGSDPAKLQRYLSVGVSSFGKYGSAIVKMGEVETVRKTLARIQATPTTSSIETFRTSGGLQFVTCTDPEPRIRTDAASAFLPPAVIPRLSELIEQAAR